MSGQWSLTENFPILWENIYMQDDYHISRFHDYIFVLVSSMQTVKITRQRKAFLVSEREALGSF